MEILQGGSRGTEQDGQEAEESERPGAPLHTVVAGQSGRTGQKVWNLLAALDAIEASDEIVAFVDADTLPAPEWLARLVAALVNTGREAVTGYRWIIPADNRVSSAIVAAANASVVTVPRLPSIINHCWGGTMAMRRTTLERIDIRRFASLHYQGQSFELRVPVAGGTLDAAALTAIGEAFGVEHERTYGHRAGADEPVELVSLEVIGRGVSAEPPGLMAAAASLAPDIAITSPVRRAYFGPARGWLDANVVNRSALAAPHEGPCIVEEYDATCLIPPGWTARLDGFGNIAMVPTPPS